MGTVLKKTRTGNDDLGLALGGILKLQFTIWYYLSLISFAAAAFLNYMRDKVLLRDAMAAAEDFDFQRNQVTGPGGGVPDPSIKP